MGGQCELEYKFSWINGQIVVSLKSNGRIPVGYNKRQDLTLRKDSI